MQAVICTGAGGREVLSWGELPDPQPAPGEVLLDVVAAGINRADILQRMGLYPPPPGASDVLGLECSGRIVDIGPGVSGWQIGDEVCALLAGGAYAQLVAAPVGQVMRVPHGVDLVQAAALPEATATVWSTMVMAAGLTAGDSVLVHGGASGIGTTAIQIAKAIGAGPVVTTVGSDVKADAVRALGADVTVDYRNEDFVDVVREVTAGRGVDVVLDIMGASYLARNVTALAKDGRLAVIGMQGGITAELDMSALVAGRKRIIGTSLRARPLDQKAAICAEVVARIWPWIEAGTVRPIVHETVPMSRVADAHEIVEDGRHIGKVLLTTGP